VAHRFRLYCCGLCVKARVIHHTSLVGIDSEIQKQPRVLFYF
jgi:hypothetical protein